MTQLTRRAFLAGSAALLPLAGCAVPPPEFEPIDYAARSDGQFTVPEVPIDRVPAGLHRQVVPFETEYPVGTIVIHSDQRSLHLVLEDGYALRYGIAIGRTGLGWTGAAEVYRKVEWPSWRPTQTMIERDPGLERWADGQPGGPRNPLGARAIYLRNQETGHDQGIRIHGTPSWRSIGRAASSGCFRMINHDVIDLYNRVPIGTKVYVS